MYLATKNEAASIEEDYNIWRKLGANVRLVDQDEVENLASFLLRLLSHNLSNFLIVATCLCQDIVLHLKIAMFSCHQSNIWSFFF